MPKKNSRKEENSDVLKILENITKYSLQEPILWGRKHTQAQDPALGQKEGLTEHLILIFLLVTSFQISGD